MTGETLPSGQDVAPTRWTLWRQDIHGNKFLMSDYPDQEQALAAEAEYTAKGHHQMYYTQEVAAEDTVDFIPAGSIQE